MGETKNEIVSKADEMQRMSEKLHEYSIYFKNLADKVDSLEEAAKK